MLPGGAYTRSFIRTYATFLGLDGERLADDYRREFEDPVGERYPRVESRGRRAQRPARRGLRAAPGSRSRAALWRR